MSRILLTGGSGFIGRNLLEGGLGERQEVLAPRHAELELMDEDAVRDYIRRNRIEIVVHAAAKPGHRNAKDPSGIFFTNTRIFFNLARNMDRLERLIVTGSGAIYDNRHYSPKMREEDYDLHIPMDEHGLSKYVIEKYIEGRERIHDLRIFGVYGRYEDYAIRFISNMTCKALLGLPLTMRQDRRFDYLWVEDLCPVVEKIARDGCSWHSINVTPDESERLSAIAAMVLEETGSESEIRISQPGMGSEYSGDNSKLKAFIPELRLTPLREGVHRLAEYYRSVLSTLDRSVFLGDK